MNVKLHHRKKFLNLTLGAAALGILFAGLVSQGVWAQTARTLRIIAPFPAGGSVDILSRLLGDQIGKTHGLTVLVENRPGAGASIAYEAAMRAVPDGNTLVINANSLVINPILRKVGYERELDPHLSPN